MQKYIQHTYVAKTKLWKEQKEFQKKKDWRQHTLILTSTYVYMHVHIHSDAQIYLRIHLNNRMQPMEKEQKELSQKS